MAEVMPRLTRTHWMGRALYGFGQDSGSDIELAPYYETYRDIVRGLQIQLDNGKITEAQFRSSEEEAYNGYLDEVQNEGDLILQESDEFFLDMAVIAAEKVGGTYNRETGDYNVPLNKESQFLADLEAAHAVVREAVVTVDQMFNDAVDLSIYPRIAPAMDVVIGPPTEPFVVTGETAKPSIVPIAIGLVGLGIVTFAMMKRKPRTA